MSQASSLSATGCSNQDICSELAGREFSSAYEHECGQLLDGGVGYCPWSLRFHAGGHFEWHYSDLLEAGDYTCDGDRITGTSNARQAPIKAFYDRNSGELIWDGNTYVPASN